MDKKKTVYGEKGAANSDQSIFSPPPAPPSASHVLILLPKMVKPSDYFEPQTTSFAPYFFKPASHLIFGSKPSILLHTFSTFVPHAPSTLTLHTFVCMVCIPLMITYGFLGVYVILTCMHKLHIN
jgi:hypothetical protein